MAFLVLLESLSPVERAVFLLREVFDYDYAGISEIVGKSEANCRQIARRAREAVAARRPRFDPAPGQGERLVRRFIEACMSGDMEDLLESMSEEITLWTDGGGRVRAARNPIHGSDRVARFLLGVIPEASEELEIRYARVNGQPGLITYHPDGSPQGAVAFDVSGGRIAAIRFVVNPEKLRSIPPLEEVEQ